MPDFAFMVIEPFLQAATIFLDLFRICFAPFFLSLSYFFYNIFIVNRIINICCIYTDQPISVVCIFSNDTDEVFKDIIVPISFAT